MAWIRGIVLPCPCWRICYEVVRRDAWRSCIRSDLELHHRHPLPFHVLGGELLHDGLLLVLQLLALPPLFLFLLPLLLLLEQLELLLGGRTASLPVGGVVGVSMLELLEKVKR